MKSFWDRAVGWVVCGIFVFGAYAIAHYMLKADDATILCFAGALIWSDIAEAVNKPDDLSSKRTK